MFGGGGGCTEGERGLEPRPVWGPRWNRHTRATENITFPQLPWRVLTKDIHYKQSNWTDCAINRIHTSRFTYQESHPLQPQDFAVFDFRSCFWKNLHFVIFSKIPSKRNLSQILLQWRFKEENSDNSKLAQLKMKTITCQCTAVFSAHAVYDRANLHHSLLKLKRLKHFYRVLMQPKIRNSAVLFSSCFWLELFQSNSVPTLVKFLNGSIDFGVN